MPQHPGIQLAPLVDVLMLLLIFFLLTWNAARNENELDVKVPKATQAKENRAPIGDVVVNVKADGNGRREPADVERPRARPICCAVWCSSMRTRRSSSAATKPAPTSTSSAC